MESFYSTLLELRKKNVALRAGDAAVKTYMINTSNDKNTICYLRKNGKSEVLVLLNMSKDPINLTLYNEMVHGSYENVFEKNKFILENNSVIELKPWGFLVLEK
jgi:glycosidase